MPLCSRKASILGKADGSWRVQFSSSSVLPYHVWQPHSPDHGWIRNLCPLLSLLKCFHNHYQYHPFFNSEHFNCPDNYCKRRLENVWSVFPPLWSSNQSVPGSTACYEQKSEEAPSSSSPTKHRLSHRWKKLQSRAGCYLNCARNSQGFQRDKVAGKTINIVILLHLLTQNSALVATLLDNVLLKSAWNFEAFITNLLSQE